MNGIIVSSFVATSSAPHNVFEMHWFFFFFFFFFLTFVAE